ncbi:hypothetical protein [Streptomyces massasporeus]|uniref:hypothetical protein n=1 Tax=Streptomyces massasporeus TaxID=67324 RepID=UPI0036B21756
MGLTDVGPVAAELGALGLPGRDLTALAPGPEPLLPADRPAVLAEVLGRDLRFHALSDEEDRAETAAGVPGCRRLTSTPSSASTPTASSTSRGYRTVEKATGRPPRGFRDRAVAHRADFAQELPEAPGPGVRRSVQPVSPARPPPAGTPSSGRSGGG